MKFSVYHCVFVCSIAGCVCFDILYAVWHANCVLPLQLPLPLPRRLSLSRFPFLSILYWSFGLCPFPVQCTNTQAGKRQSKETFRDDEEEEAEDYETKRQQEKQFNERSGGGEQNSKKGWRRRRLELQAERKSERDRMSRATFADAYLKAY